jgi:hypothetical protein
VLTAVGQIAVVASPLGGLPALRLFVGWAGARMSAGATVLLAGLATLAALGLLIGGLR